MRRALATTVSMVSALLTVLPAAGQELMANDFIGRFRVYSVLDGKPTLADPTGRTLYAYEKDEPMKSNCVGACAQAWPPAVAAADDKDFGDFKILTRDDGVRQWTFKGKPMYLSAKDTAPAQANGHGADDAWFIVLMEAAHEM